MAPSCAGTSPGKLTYGSDGGGQTKRKKSLVGAILGVSILYDIERYYSDYKSGAGTRYN